MYILLYNQTHYTVGGKDIYHPHIMSAGCALRDDAMKQALWRVIGELIITYRSVCCMVFI